MTDLKAAVERVRKQIETHNAGRGFVLDVADLEVILAALEAGQWRPTHRHKKRGSLYAIVGTANIQTDSTLSDMAPVVIYRGEDGHMWARSLAEFGDGRFEVLPPASEG